VRKLIAVSVAVLMLTVGLTALAQDQTQEQVADSGLVEEVKVKLVMIDVLVTNKKGETVPDLKKEDFELKIGGVVQEIDTFDLHCPIGASPDPKEIATMRQLKESPRWSPTPDVPRRVVFVFDYYTIDVPDRQRLLDAAQYMIQSWKPDNEEIMVAALADGLRVEQRFTKNTKQIQRTLRRMEVDETLWPRTFGTGSGRIWFEDLAVLMDVLGAYDGPKAVVFFSNGLGHGATKDLWFDMVSERATIGRSAFYPTFGAFNTHRRMALGPLARLANDTGGRMPPNTSFDVSISYARAQRDLACRYSLGIYSDQPEKPKLQRVRVWVDRENTRAAYPENFRLWDAEKVRESRMRAAFHDPEVFENPLVRASAFPVRLKSADEWDTLLAAHFKVPMDGKARTMDVAATLTRPNGTRIGKYKDQIEIAPPKEGRTRPVTIIGDRKFKPGQYKMTIAASEPGGKNVVSSSVDITIPMIPENVMILQGPILARVQRDGLLVRSDKKSDQKNPNEAVLKDLIGEDGSFEPMLVHEAERTDTVMALWEVCMVGDDAPTGPSNVDRVILDAEGKEAHRFERVPLELRKHKSTFCGGKLDSFEVSVLDPGEYTLEVVVEDAETGDMITKAGTPLVVH
jgi:VWFA-related protein